MQNWIKAVEPVNASLDKWSDKNQSTWQSQLSAFQTEITASIPSDGGLAVTRKMQDWIKTVEPVNASLDKWSDEAQSTWQDQLNAYKAGVTSSISSDGGVAATQKMQSWMEAVEPVSASLDRWSEGAKSTWKDQLDAWKAKITSSIPFDGGVAATTDMQNWMKAAEPVVTSLEKWSSGAKSLWKDLLNAYKSKITSSIPSDRELAATTAMQNWMKVAEPVAASLDKWSSSGAKSRWEDQLSAYEKNITSSIPSDGGIAATQEMQKWMKAAEPLSASLDKWSSGAKSTWRDQLNAYKTKITSSIPSGGGLAATTDMENWVKTVDDDLASGGKLTTQRAQERHKADEEKRVAQEKAAAELAAQERAQEQQRAKAQAEQERQRQAFIQSFLKSEAYPAALASGKEAALQMHGGGYESHYAGGGVMKMITDLGNAAVSQGNCEDKAQVIMYIETALSQCIKTLTDLDDPNAQGVQSGLNRLQQDPDRTIQFASQSRFW
jgi:hypothetical protein